MKYIILIVLFPCLSFTSFSQHERDDPKLIIRGCGLSDSLVVNSITKNVFSVRKKNFDILIEIGDFWKRNDKNDRAIFYYMRAKQMALLLNSLGNVRFAQYHIMSTQPLTKDTELLKYFEDSYSEEQKLNSLSVRNLAYLGLQLSKYYYESYKFKKSMHWSLKALGVKNGEIPLDLRAHLLNQSALCLIQIGDNEKGLEQLKKIDKINHAQIDPISLASIELNKGMAYLFIGDLSKAEENLVSSYKRALELKTDKVLSTVCFNLSELEYLKGDVKNALSYVDSSIVYSRLSKNHLGLLNSLYFKGMLQLNQKQFKECKQSIDAFETELGKHYDLEHATYLNELKAEYFHSIGEIEKAYQLKCKFIELADKLRGKSQQIQIANMTSEFEEKQLEDKLFIQKKDFEIKQKNLMAKKERFEKWIFVLTSCILLVILLFSVYVLMNKSLNRKKYTHRLIARIDEEKRKISSDLHDHIGHMLVMLKYHLKRNFMDSENGLNSTQIEVESILNETRKLSYEFYPQKIIVHGFILSIESLIEAVNADDELKITHSLNPDLEKLSIQEKNNLYRIVQEMIQNTIKYSKANAANLRIEIKEKVVKIEYVDNGVGIKQKYLHSIGKKETLFFSIRERVDILKGKFNYFSEKNSGLKYLVSFESNFGS